MGKSWTIFYLNEPDGPCQKYFPRRRNILVVFLIAKNYIRRLTFLDSRSCAQQESLVIRKMYRKCSPELRDLLG